MPPAIAQPAAEKPETRSSRRYIILIWSFCLLLVAGIWAAVVAQIAFERRHAIDEGIRQNVNRSIAFEQFVRRTLDGADMATRYISERYARGAAGGEFAGTPGRPAPLRGGLARGGTFLGVSIINVRGDIVATSSAQPLANRNVAAHPAFRVHVARDGGRLYVSPPIRLPALNRQVIWLSRRLNHPDGSFAGVVALVISPEQFTGFYRDARINPTDVMSVIGLDGITRARRAGNVSSAGEDLRGKQVMREQVRNPNGTYLGPSALSGMVRYFSHRRIPGYPLFVSYGVEEAAMLAPSRQRARIFIAAAALVSLLIAAFAALLSLTLSRRERRALEMARANERLEEAQRIGQMGDWHFDFTTRATHWSPQMYAMHERDPSLGPIPAREYRAMLNHAGKAAIDQAVAEVGMTASPQEFELELRLPSGAEVCHQIVAIPLLDANGSVTGLRGTSLNISGRKQVERLETQLAHLSRVEAMNAMAATLAHELNQPLAAASNYLAGSRRMLKGGKPGEAERGMAAAERQVHLAADIIRGVREMVANQPRTVVSVSLLRAIDDATALIAVPSLFPRLTLRKEIAADAKSVKADRIQLQQVLMNLIRNAGDATAGRLDPEIAISSRRGEAGHVIVCVGDNGAGFSQAADDRFSPFASTKNAGLGLGLSISRTIIEAHGGRIWIEDGVGEGARICFTLPAVRRPREKNPSP